MPWGILGLMVGIAGLYAAFRESAPRVTLEILSVSNVFDVHRPLPELTVIFKGQDIQQSGKNLKVATLALANNGDKNVVQGDYDQSQPFGLVIPKAQIVGAPRVIRADSDYLQASLRPTTTNETTIDFAKIILERGQSVVFEILILQDKDAPLALEPKGKISGQSSIFIKDRRQDNAPSFAHRLIDGGIVINVTRLVVSLILLIIILVVVVGLGELISSLNAKRMAKRADRFVEPFIDHLTEKQQQAVKSVLAHALEQTSADEVMELFRDPNALNQIQEASEQMKVEQARYEQMIRGRREYQQDNAAWKRNSTLRALARNVGQLTAVNNGRAEFDPQVIAAMRDVFAAVKEGRAKKIKTWRSLRSPSEASRLIDVPTPYRIMVEARARDIDGS